MVQKQVKKAPKQEKMKSTEELRVFEKMIVFDSEQESIKKYI